jgi:hypothetical protein
MANEFVTRNGLISLGGVTFPYKAVTTTYPVLETDYFIECTTGTFTVTLPTAVGIAGKTYIIKNRGSGVITVGTTSSQTIDGVTTRTLATYSTLYVESNGANWSVSAASAAGGSRQIALVTNLASAGATGTINQTHVGIGYNGTITGWYLTCFPSATVSVDVWKVSGGVPTIANTITGSAKPSVTAARFNSSTTLTGWTTSVSAGDYFMMSVDTNNSATYINLQLIVSS